MLNNKFSNKKLVRGIAINTLNDTVGEIMLQYHNHPEAKVLEAMIANHVKDHGDVDVLHMFYFSCITLLVQEIACNNNILLANRINALIQGCDIYYAIENIAYTIYRLQKEALGLRSDGFVPNAITFDVAASKCVNPIDKVTMREMMNRVESKVTSYLSKLDLEKQETVFYTWGVFVDTFAFYKILAFVYECTNDEKWKEVKGIDSWLMVSATYEMACHVYNNYVARKQK